MNRGVAYAFGAYGIWGLFPLYWKLLDHVPAMQVTLNRIVWSALLLVVILTVRKEWRAFGEVLKSWRTVLVYVIASALLTGNWFLYIWAVNSDRIVESSLGYFINPLVSIVLGVVFLKEHMRPWQWVAVGTAAVGVLYLTVTYGQLPWIALTLALTFGTYGLLKKLVPLDSSHGLMLETGAAFIPAVVALAILQSQGTNAIATDGFGTVALLVGAGFATTVPLLMFATAAKLIPLSWVGIIQYITPSLQFLLGIFLYGEVVTTERLFGFSIVWLALGIFGVEGLLARRSAQGPTAEVIPAPAE